MQKMWTVDDVTAYLQITRVTLDRLVEQGEFPEPVRLGPSLLRWRQLEIAEWESGLTSATPVRVEFTEPFRPYKVGESAEFSQQEAAILLIEGVAKLLDEADSRQIAPVKRQLMRRRIEWLGAESFRLGLLKDWNGIGRATHARDGLRDEIGTPQVPVRFLKDWEEWKAGQECSLSMEQAATLCSQHVIELANKKSAWSLVEDLVRQPPEN